MKFLNNTLNQVKFFLLEFSCPKSIIFLIDITITSTSLFLSLILRFGFIWPEFYINNFIIALLVVISLRSLMFFIFKTFKGILRYTNFNDITKIILSIILGTISIFIFNYLYYKNRGFYLLPTSVILMEAVLTAYIMTSLRLMIKHIFIHLNYEDNELKYVLIYGSRQLAALVKSALDLDESHRFKVLAFFDDDYEMIDKSIHGIPILHPKKIDKILNSKKIDYFIFAKPNINQKYKHFILKKCLNKNIKLLTVPEIDKLLNGNLRFNQIRELKIEDLLDREPIKLDITKIKNQISDKTILITGAAGSIGSELVRQIIKFNPKLLILYDMAETSLYELELEIYEKHNFANFVSILGDVRNKDKLRKIFEHFSPEIVFHAAAYKHVPVMEKNPSEGISTNILGTKILADLSHEFNVEKFIFISTDKAVNPTGIMGATKRIAEMYIQSLNDYSSTAFITTRFGNVLGSNGSVIPRFIKQIKEGGPITITHPEITRYFMTIPEACQLVLEAAAMGKGGEIFLFDMGKPIKILDLAKNLIKLLGYKENDIKIIFTGLRPGEKLYEELLLNSEKHKPTYHPKILIAEVEKNNYEEINTYISKFLIPVKNDDIITIIKLIKEKIPTITARSEELLYNIPLKQLIKS